jgi:flagellar hook-length control protein FliK
VSALNNARSLDALSLKPQAPAVNGVSATNQAKASTAKDETNKATFSRHLAHSRAAAAATQPPPASETHSATSPASPPRAGRSAARQADDKADKAADAVEPRASMTPVRSGEATRSASTNKTPDRGADADASAETTDATSTSDDDAHPTEAGGTTSDLASLLAGAIPPAPAATPPEAQTGMAGGEATADPMRPAAASLAALGKAGVGPAGIDAFAKPSAGVKVADKSFASAIAATLTEDPGLGQAAQAPTAGDPKAAIDATVISGGLPNAALANLAALSVGAGKTDEAPKTNAALDALPLGAGSAIAGQGATHLARPIDSPAVATATVSTAVGDPGFHEALAAQVTVFARGGLSKAELHLNPAELGPVSVQITMNGDQARVDFGADRAQTRQVIEAGWAELATSLKDAGFTLSGGGVSEQAQRQASQPQTAPQNGRTDRSVVADDVPVASIVAARPRAGSALDLYA